MCASVEGRTDVIKLLLQQGAKVDATDEYGRTALSWAATKGDFHEAAEALISAGAKVNCADKGGFTPLMRAALMKHPRCFSTLITHGADVRIKHPQLGTTALDMAKNGGGDQMSQLANRVEQEHSPHNS